MKSFKIDGDEYQAEDSIDGIFINPLLPENFWTEPLENRSEEHMRLWLDFPFIVSDNEFYKVYCLDRGAWDRPSLKGGFDTQEQAINFIIGKYRTVT
jgi:hypothetical protein